MAERLERPYTWVDNTDATVSNAYQESPLALVSDWVGCDWMTFSKGDAWMPVHKTTTLGWLGRRLIIVAPPTHPIVWRITLPLFCSMVKSLSRKESSHPKVRRDVVVTWTGLSPISKEKRSLWFSAEESDIFWSYPGKRGTRFQRPRNGSPLNRERL